MTNNNSSNDNYKSESTNLWANPTSYGPDAEPVDHSMISRRLRLMNATRIPEPRPVRSDNSQSAKAPIPWIRTKKNGATVSKLGVTLWDIVLLALLTVALGFVAAGYQFHFWDWVCAGDSCPSVSNLITPKG